MSQDTKLCNDFYHSVDYAARAAYDSVPMMGCSILQNIINIDEYNIMHNQEVENQRKILSEKSKLFVKLAKENNIDILPHTEGFFVTVKTDNSNDVYEKMIQKGVFGVPLKYGYRIALCSINIDDIPIIIEKLK